MEEFYVNCDGIRLHAKLDMPNGVDKCPLCIYYHGFTGHMEEDQIVGPQIAMNEAGVAVLRVEGYGHGGSDGTFREHTLYKWITGGLAVMDYVKTLDFVTDLYLCGHSQGGLLVMLLAGMRPDDVKALLPLSPAWTIPEGARNGTVLGVSFDPEHIPDTLQFEENELSGDYIRVAQTIHVEDEVARYKGPVLIVHGDEDESVAYEDSVRLAPLYRDATFITIHGDDHCYTRHLDRVNAVIKDFFMHR
ncbi:MAG: lysophospholipase [Lachnospiraceae bacterium]|nr:lysophospholipase [Lachnospiraceae bacterium]